MLCHVYIHIMLPLNHRHYHDINGKRRKCIQTHTHTHTTTVKQQEFKLNDNICKRTAVEAYKMLREIWYVCVSNESLYGFLQGKPLKFSRICLHLNQF